VPMILGAAIFASVVLILAVYHAQFRKVLLRVLVVSVGLTVVGGSVWYLNARMMEEQMYCPLCKAEYRDGFDQCSDCRAKLLTREEAEAAKVALLWKGTSAAKFDEIVAALRDANIPNHSRSGARSEEYKPFFRISAFLQLRKQMSWEVSVLESDFVKARELVG
jgi:hypothetical protein